jgi:hypothetical protein
MKGYPIQNESVKELVRIAIQGNVIPIEWYRTIKRDAPVVGGRKMELKPDLVAISILADIVYWYRPMVVRDEVTGDIVGRRQKFMADKLQRSYGAYVKMYGLGEFQVKRAFDTLVNIGVVDLEFRTIIRDNGQSPLHNVMFIGLNTQRLMELTYLESDTRFKARGDGHFKASTYTENTEYNNLINTDAHASVEGVPSFDKSQDIFDTMYDEQKENSQKESEQEPEPTPILEPVYEDIVPEKPVKEKKARKKIPNKLVKDPSSTDFYPMEYFRKDVRPNLQMFCDETGIKPLWGNHTLWYQQANLWKNLGMTPEKIKMAISMARKKGMAIKSPRSLEYWVSNPTALDDNVYTGVTMEDLRKQGFIP